MKKRFGLIVFCCLALTGFAQVPPSDLYLFQVEENPAGDLHVFAPKYLSAFNQGGYTNQPWFMNPQELFVSVRTEQAGQHDIYAIHIGNGTIRKVTDTPQNEYSPTLLPGGQRFACVRQTTKGMNRQQLAIYPLDQSGNGKLYFTDLQNIGYFCPLGEDLFALFLVDGENQLAIADMNTGKTEVLFSNIGRCMRRHPDGSLVYVHKYTDNYWYLKVYDPESSRASIIAETLQGQEDFCIDRDGRIIMGKGARLYLHPGVENGDWVEIADLSKYGIKQITRLALSSDNQLALINTNE